MTADPQPPPASEPSPADPVPATHRALADAVLHPHAQAAAALDDPGTSSLAAVTWLAAHLAATEQCLYTLARRRLPDGAARVRELVVVDQRLHDALWRLDRRLTGDVHLRGDDVDELERAVRARLEEHAERERTLLEELALALDEAEVADLVEQTASVLRHAPTRPHPHTSHHPWVSGAMFRLDAFADRLRDLMDNRDVPTPHDVPVPREAGRWGSYLLGRPYGWPGIDPGSDDETDDALRAGESDGTASGAAAQDADAAGRAQRVPR